MLFSVGNTILSFGGKLLTVTSDFSLEFEVQGTCFPAKITQGDTRTAEFSFSNINGLDNKVFIDFADGTGEHEYAFKRIGSASNINFRNLANGTTPETIQGSAWNDAPVYFYQDLPEGVKNTVQETYPQKRIIKIRFENPNNLRGLSILRLLLFGTFPSNVSKYNSLQTLDLNSVMNLEAFQQDFYNSSIKNLTLLTVGQVLNNGIPNWIVNSVFMEVLVLSNSVNLSSNLATNNLLNIDNLKETLHTLYLENTGIDYQLPNSVGNLYKLNLLVLNGNQSTNLRMPENLEDMVALTNLQLRGVRVPFSEIERIIDEVPNLEALNISSGNHSSNQNITNNNTGLKTIYIGGQTWGVGGVPGFVNKLLGLQELYVGHPNTTAPYNGITNYGDFSNCVDLSILRIHRLSDLTTSIPAWFDSLVNLKTMNVYASFQNTGGINSYVDNFYDFVVANASMASGNTAFRNMTMDAYSANITDQNNSTRPTGTYQQPSGFVLGSSNGTPASPMEKIWVLTNQYGHTWTVKPA